MNATGLCPAHNAAARNRIGILALIAQYNGGHLFFFNYQIEVLNMNINFFLVDLNIVDKNGWTPLHHAVKNSALKSIDFLLDHGVDDVRLNRQNEAAIHVAVIHNQLQALTVSLFIYSFI